jgi:hypothetical protein
MDFIVPISGFNSNDILKIIGAFPDVVNSCINEGIFIVHDKGTST